ncbi:hypothetical protein [Streptomyces vastus]|uniref:hypothetical protein n=1 Tax=Streptomyces vastus TaxID=285451 RepID=UPI003CD05479
MKSDELRRWIANRFHHQRHIPVKDALILAEFDGPALRRACAGSRTTAGCGTARAASSAGCGPARPPA